MSTALTEQAQRITDAVAIIDRLELSDIEKETLIRFIKPEDMIDRVNVEHANIMIGQAGHHLWVCTEGGTVLRIKANSITLDDRRVPE